MYMHVHVLTFYFLSLGELESELGNMRVGLKDIDRELKYQRSRTEPAPKGDRFVNVMADFMAVSAYNFSDLEDLVIEMKEKVTSDFYLLIYPGFHNIFSF